MRGFRLCWFVMVVACAAAIPFAGQAQNVGVVQSDVLVLDPDRLFSETMFGQRLNSDYLEQRELLNQRDQSLKLELEAEEQTLTDLRTQRTPEEFRDLADAFDEKVQTIRRDFDRAVRDLELSRERAPLIFMRTVEPILLDLMRDAGGAVVLDVRGVLFRAEVIDITDVAIARIDQAIGQGPGAQPATPQPEPDTQDTPTQSPEPSE